MIEGLASPRGLPVPESALEIAASVRATFDLTPIARLLPGLVDD